MVYETKYGDIPDISLELYFERMVGKTYKILALKEEDCSTVDVYIDSLLYEIIGTNKIVDQIPNETTLLTIIAMLEQLKGEDNHSIIKQKVFKIIKLIKNILASMDGH